MSEACRRAFRSSVYVLGTLGMGSIILGCSGDTIGTAPLVTPETLFNVTLNQHAINMALTGPSSTIQLTAVGTTASGDSVAMAIHPTFAAADSSVTVSATGLVTAHYVTQYGGTQVIAKVQENNVTYADTAFIRVTATAPTPGLKTFSVGDSASLILNAPAYTPNVEAYDSAGQPMSFSTTAGTGAQNFFWMASANPSVAKVQGSPGGIGLDLSPNTIGHATVYVTSWVYGVVVKDSIVLNIELPMHVNNIFDNLFDSVWDRYSIILGAGGVIDWIYVDGGNFTIVFDDSTAVDSALNTTFSHVYTGSGNIHWPSQISTDQARSYPTPGVYHFHDLLNPTLIGTITVLKNSL